MPAQPAGPFQSSQGGQQTAPAGTNLGAWGHRHGLYGLKTTNKPICRHFSRGANRDPTGDLLLAKRPLPRPISAPKVAHLGFGHFRRRVPERGGAGSEMIPTVSVWQQLADEQILWSTVAGASAALLIALVLEARTSREELDERVRASTAARDAALGERELEVKEKLAEWRLFEQEEGPKPADLKEHGPLPAEDLGQAGQANQTVKRLGRLARALWASAGGFVGCLVVLSPVHYPGNTAAAVGMIVTLCAVGFGLWGLVSATTSRITESSRKAK